MLEKLRIKWGLQSLVQVILVLTVFSLTGTTVVMLRPVLFAWLGLGTETVKWTKILAYIAFIFPAYQLLLLGYGFLLGQFKFFWEKERQLWHRIEKIFARKGQTVQRISRNLESMQLKGAKAKNHESWKIER